MAQKIAKKRRVSSGLKCDVPPGTSLHEGLASTLKLQLIQDLFLLLLYLPVTYN